MYKILVVDDAKDSIMLLNFDLSAAGYKVISASSGDQALLLLQSESVDLILLDMYMPGRSGLATLQHLKSETSTVNIPVIMLSSADGEDDIVNALEFGVDDYVTKPYIAKVLLARIRTSLRIMEKNRELEILACTDHLTTINNRRHFYDLAEKVISQSKRNGQEVVVAMFDIDDFKLVNDHYGHESGDNVLIDFAGLMRTTFRDYDVLGRVGGEEFAVCMPDVSVELALKACERLRQAVEEHQVPIVLPAQLQAKNISVTVSIGLASARAEMLDLTGLLRRADKSLYRAKQNGRNRIIAATALTQESIIADPQQQQQAVHLPGIEEAEGIKNVLGDRAIFNEILQMFYEDHHDDKDKLAQALESHDYQQAKHIAHTLKGVSSSVGAMDLFKRAQKLDIALREGDIDSYPALLNELRQEMCRVMQGIHKAFNEGGKYPI